MSKNQVEIIESQSGNYGLMIQVRTPVTFYWNQDGSFDGIDVQFEDEPNVKESIAMFHLLEKIGDLM